MIPMQQDETVTPRPDPYKLGELAARAGRALSECPFGVNDVDRVDWMLGYHQLQEPHGAPALVDQAPGNQGRPAGPAQGDRP